MTISPFPIRVRLFPIALAGSLLLTATFAGGMSNANPIHSRQSVTRLRFAPGQDRISIRGTLSVSGQRPIYSYYAKAGQLLMIDLQDIAPKNDHQGHLVSMYHIMFPSGKQYGMKGYDPFEGRLTETGFYYIVLNINQMASTGKKGEFRLTLKR